MTTQQKQELIEAIDEWILSTQESDEPIDMFISDTLAARMADAALAVARESQGTQAWLKREGYMKPGA